MSNHPNRSKRRNLHGATPLPENIKAMRDRLGMTHKEFGKMGFYSELAAQQWETGERRMTPLSWWAYQRMEKDINGN